METCSKKPSSGSEASRLRIVSLINFASSSNRAHVLVHVGVHLIALDHYQVVMQTEHTVG